MNQDESGAPIQALTQQAPQQPQNALGGMVQGGQPQQGRTALSKHQVMAGLHHLTEFQRKFAPLLKNSELGKSNIRPKIFDAAATLIGEGTMTVPMVMNGIKSLPSEPVGQKKWLEQMVSQAAMAEKKLLSDYIAQGPGNEPDGPAWSIDSHHDHIGGLMGAYKK